MKGYENNLKGVRAKLNKDSTITVRFIKYGINIENADKEIVYDEVGRKKIENNFVSRYSVTYQYNEDRKEKIDGIQIINYAE